ncbi:MAG: DUF374 domain-containing protein [Planctomycetota bacterium]|nr:DUF374 domain-containing protein [Planctomycetota bacterium]MDW8373143.1 DUF374 domain-containing protein [Planctomycetota bacterium]
MRIRVPLAPVQALAQAWTASWRILRAATNERHLAAARAQHPRGALIAAFWHEHLLLAAAAHRHWPVTALVSRSQDGELIAGYLERSGLRCVRGSSHRGAVPATQELIAQLDEGRILALACDGPRGPRHQPKPGAWELARRYGLAILPLGFAAARAWRLPSWDRFVLPWPGTRIAVAYGEPLCCAGAARAGAAELAALAQRIAAAEEGAAALLGGRLSAQPRAAGGSDRAGR